MNSGSRMLLIGIVGILIIGAVVWTVSRGSRPSHPVVFSPTQVLGATWLAYKQNYIEPTSGRTVDPLRQNVTTSEGESYTMLRSVWMADKPTFDASWRWTKQNLQHTSGDQLFSWLYGQLPNGSYGVLTAQSGNTTASDADQDIALALIFAYARWQDPSYLAEARTILNGLWTNDVVTIAGVPYLAADNLEKGSSASSIIVNPSYLSPAAYRVFALADSSHPWNALVDSSYTVLGKSIDAPLDTGKSAGLPPDWVRINKRTGTIEAPSGTPGATSHFGFDALRTPWRLALDYGWFHDPRDLAILSRMRFLTYTWNAANAIGETYAHDGTLVDANQATAMYGGTIGYFMHEDPANAQSIYDQKLLGLYNPDSNLWNEKLSYYDDNWAWFGVALYANLLPNLTVGLPQSAWK